MLSAEWERVDLPNLNNGTIKKAYYYDSLHVFQKQDGEYLITTNFKDWKSLDSSSVKDKIYEELKIGFSDYEKEYLKEKIYENLWNSYNKHGLVYYNQDSNHIIHEIRGNDRYKRNFRIDVGDNRSKSIINKDKYLYFLYSDSLYVIDSTKVSRYYVDSSLYDESALMARMIDGKVYLRSTVFENKDKEYKYFTTINNKVNQIDSFDVSKIIIDNFTSGLISEFNFLTKYNDLVIPNNTYIEDFYVNNDILRISSDLLSIIHYDLINQKEINFLDLSFSNNIRLNYYRFGEYYVLTSNDEDIKSKIEIYDTNYVLVKNIEFEFESRIPNGYCVILNHFNNSLIFGCGNYIYRLDLESLEYQKVLESNYSFHEYSEELILKFPQYYDPKTDEYIYSDDVNNYSAFSYSFDGGKNWTIDTLYAEISDKHFNTCSRGKNSHSISLLGETIYSFTKDTIFVAKVEQGNYSSLIALNYEYKIKHKDNYYVMDFDNGNVYVLDRNGEYKTIYPPTENVVDFDLDNDYLYIANNKELFRLKLE